MFGCKKEKSLPHANETGSISTKTDGGFLASKNSIAQISPKIKDSVLKILNEGNPDARNYRCRNCGTAFNDPKQKKVGDEIIQCCPECTSDDILKYVESCLSCGKALYELDSAFEVKGVDGVYCTDCVTEIIC